VEVLGDEPGDVPLGRVDLRGLPFLIGSERPSAERCFVLASEGWWSGDSHVHFLSTPGAQLEQRGENLRVVNLLQTQWGALFTNAGRKRSPAGADEQRQACPRQRRLEHPSVRTAMAS
jgi:hypothetical protein